MSYMFYLYVLNLLRNNIYINALVHHTNLTSNVIKFCDKRMFCPIDQNFSKENQANIRYQYPQMF